MSEKYASFCQKSNLRETNQPETAQKKDHPADGLLPIDKPGLLEVVTEREIGDWAAEDFIFQPPRVIELDEVAKQHGSGTRPVPDQERIFEVGYRGPEGNTAPAHHFRVQTVLLAKRPRPGPGSTDIGKGYKLQVPQEIRRYVAFVEVLHQGQPQFSIEQHVTRANQFALPEAP